MTPNDNTQNNYAATMAAYAKSASSLLARLDGCSHQASASSSAVKSVNREPTEKNITRKEM